MVCRFNPAVYIWQFSVGFVRYLDCVKTVAIKRLVIEFNVLMKCCFYLSGF